MPRQRQPLARRARRSRAPRLCIAAHVGDRWYAGEDRARNAAPATFDRAAAEWLGAERRYLSTGRQMERQSRRARSGSFFQKHGFATRLDVFAIRAASLYAENAHA